MTDEPRAPRTPDYHRTQAANMGGDAETRLFDALRMNAHDARRRDALIAANTLALIANRHATEELSALIRESRRAREDRA